jgi:hypothetical protein
MTPNDEDSLLVQRELLGSVFVLGVVSLSELVHQQFFLKLINPFLSGGQSFFGESRNFSSPPPIPSTRLAASSTQRARSLTHKCTVSSAITSSSPPKHCHVKR